MSKPTFRTMAQPGMNTGDGSDAGRVASASSRGDVGSSPTGAAIFKYQPRRPATVEEIDAAKRIVLRIVEAFGANFQNDETDLARMITDEFTLR